jgi:hypothetical protein
VAGRNDLRLSGVGLDGEGRVQDLDVLQGVGGSVTLCDLHLKGFRHTGIGVRGCAGAGVCVSLERLRVSGGDNASSALVFDAAPGESNRNIVVHECRFEGPFGAAVIL